MTGSPARTSFHRSSWFCAGLLAASAVVSPAGAEEALKGRFSLGWRFVDHSGSEAKYRQHFNLQEGARVFGIDLEFQPDSEFVDVLELHANSLGGEPYESIDIAIRRFGSYRFEFGRRTTQTFYEDLLVPASQVNPRISNGGDFHHFDFERIRDFAHLDLQLSPRMRLDANLDRYSKRGDSTTTLDISRDEFEIDQPLDESLDQLSVGFQMRWDKASLAVQETVREHSRARELFLPGRSEGENPGPAILDFYFLDEPIDADAKAHRAVLNTRPHSDVALTFSVLVDELELKSRPSERANGIAFNGSPLAIEASGNSRSQRDAALFELDTTWWLSPRLALALQLRHRTIDQDGRLDFDGDEPRTSWQIDTSGADLSVEFQASEDVTLSAGLLQETRDVDHSAQVDALESTSTDQFGVRLAASWQATSALRVGVSFEDSTIDDPFTLASATDRERVRLEAKLQQPTGWFVRALLQIQNVENSNSAWQSDYDWFDLQFGYRSETIRAALGASRFDVERSIDQLVTTTGFGGGASFLFPIFYASEIEFLHASVDWDAHPRLRLGGTLRFYDNAGDFSTQRDDLAAYLEAKVSDHYFLRLAVRTIDYQEQRFGLNDYDADLVELGIGYRF